MYKLSIKDRFIEILHICDMSRRDFCKYIEIDERVFLRFISKNSFSQEHLEKFYNMGININWLLTGRENKFNDSYFGKKIEKQLNFEQENAQDENYLMFKLDKWISMYYESIHSFEKLHRIDNYKYFQIIEESNIVPVDLLNLLKKEGLNLKWLYKSNESTFSNSVEGRRKKRNLLRFLNKNNIILSDIWNIK